MHLKSGLHDNQVFISGRVSGMNNAIKGNINWAPTVKMELLWPQQSLMKKKIEQNIQGLDGYHLRVCGEKRYGKTGILFHLIFKWQNY